jgi:peptide chain release factor
MTVPALHEAWLHVTAGQGPVECAWAAHEVCVRLLEEAHAARVEAEIVESVRGPEPGTVQSALAALRAPSTASLAAFLARWTGTILWTARSPFRPEHRRKNWFVGVQAIEPVPETLFDAREVRVETMRASGPGGQHVNRTESAVRVTHVPTGLQASASEERSQHRNRALAFARLQAAIAARDEDARRRAAGERWRSHQDLVRGNPVRSFRG